VPTSSAARDHPTAVFYGDSIVTGWRGTTAPRRRWSSLVSDELGWREVCLAVDGMGFYRRRGPRGPSGALTPSATDTTLLDAAVRLAPEVVVVCLAANDLVHVEDHGAEVRHGVRRDLGRLRDGLPEALVAVTTYFPTAQLSPRAALLIGWVSAAAEEFGHAWVPGFRSAIAGRAELLCDDRVHPNDDGHAALAAAVLPTLRAFDVLLADRRRRQA
jgi:lysophospholipase L1-like esterase